MVRILLVEDDVQLREELGEFLSDKGYELIYASNGRDALEILNKTEIHLVITDLVMPGMDGMDVLTEIKKLNLNVPSIMITAFATVKSAVEAMKKGASDYIEKPFNLEEVETTVRRVLEESKLMIRQKRVKIHEMKESFVERAIIDSKVLNSSIRREIVKTLGSAQCLRFTDLKKKLCIDNPPLLSFHLRILKDAGLVQQDPERNYVLSPKGADVFKTMRKISEKMEKIFEDVNNV